MLKYAKILNKETNEVSVGEGTNTEFYKSIGMTEIEVEQAYNGSWYVQGYAPEQPAPTEEEQRQKRAEAYTQEIDPLHAQKQRRVILGTWTEEDEQEYVQKVKELSEDISKRFPYPVGEPEYEAMD